MEPNTIWAIGIAACAVLGILSAWLSSALTYSDGMSSAEGSAFALLAMACGLGFVACIIGAALT